MSDLIDRQAAIDAMFAEMPGLTFNDVLRILRTLPSAQPEQKAARWKGEGFGYYRCSLCGMIGNGTRYCPNCGAYIGEGGER